MDSVRRKELFFSYSQGQPPLCATARTRWKRRGLGSARIGGDGANRGIDLRTQLLTTCAADWIVTLSLFIIFALIDRVPGAPFAD